MKQYQEYFYDDFLKSTTKIKKKNLHSSDLEKNKFSLLIPHKIHPQTVQSNFISHNSFETSRLHTYNNRCKRFQKASLPLPALPRFWRPHFGKERRNLARRLWRLSKGYVSHFVSQSRIHVGSKGFPGTSYLSSPFPRILLRSPLGEEEMSRTILSKVSTSPPPRALSPPRALEPWRAFWYISSIFDKANRRGNIVSRHDYSGTAAVLTRFSRSLEKNIASPQFRPNTSLFPSLTLELLFTRNLHVFSPFLSLSCFLSRSRKGDFTQGREISASISNLLNL